MQIKTGLLLGALWFSLSGGYAGTLSDPDPCEGVICVQPPDDTCLDGSTRRTWLTPGTCSGGQCSYEPVDEVCEDGCRAGVCRGDPCAGVTCDQPPEPLCVDAGLIRTYQQGGQCEQGFCVYLYQSRGSGVLIYHFHYIW